MPNSTDSSSSGLPDEPSAILAIERLYMAGAGIGCVAYGVQATLFFLCLNQLLQEYTNPARRRRAVWMIVYISALFITGTIGGGSQMKEMELAYIDHREEQGGPASWIEGTTEHPLAVAGFAAYVINEWLQDALLLYRFLVIWDFWLPVIVIPSLLWLVNMVLGIFLLTEISQPMKSLWQTTTVNFGVSYWSTSVATNLLLTLLIVTRLIWMRVRLRRVMGKSVTSPYLSVSTMLIESAALYSAIALGFIVSFALNDPVNILFLPVVGQASSIAPLLIILRVSQGRGWSKETFQETGYTMSRIRFGHGSGTLRPGDSAGAAASASAPVLDKSEHSGVLVFSRSQDDIDAKQTA